MARLDIYLTHTGFTRISRIIQLVNILQLVSALISLVAFLLSVYRPPGQITASNHFPIESQIVVFGLYLATVIVPVLLSAGKNPGEAMLMLSEILSIVATAVGAIVIAVVFQGYADLKLPLLFTLGYLVNIPVLIGRVTPLTHIWHRKRRGVPVGDYGNLNGIQMEMQVTKLKTLAVYAVILGIPSSIVVAELIAQLISNSPALDGPAWTLFSVIGVFLTCIAISVVALSRILKGKTGWQKLVLDTYEEKTLWWYDSKGSLIPVRLPSCYVTSVGYGQVKLYMVRGGASTNLKFRSESDLSQFLIVVDATRLPIGQK